MVEELRIRIGLPSRISGWVAGFVANSKPSRSEKAFALWRCFWEGLTDPSNLGDVKEQYRANDVWSVLKTYFGASIVPAGLPPQELTVVNCYVLKSILQATFVFSYNLVGRQTSRALHALPETPLPVFLVKTTERSVIVEWIHQREIAETWHVFQRG